MSAGDWISFGRALVALAALGIAARSYQLSKTTQESDDVKQFGDLVQKTQDALAKLPQTTTFDTESYATNGATLAAIQVYALDAHQLVVDQKVKPNSFDSVVLAFAFTQLWDGATAITYWNGAL